ncbi:uncharacterized protein LTR77_008405 [Saxophila tyrrhenica]|uniref:Histidine acid phosphatase n=1 Tax=Saxophila tyrrhenica TaxID=1690608 RepID=A0AAV9P0U9_9PEZI|nr:hypothetical protein LTR77_008405 [Saxophila tyrrhenica]
MYTLPILALAAALPTALSQSSNSETILGVYMFHRHGDRTAKITAPANLTDLGYRQVYDSGSYYRSRYIDSGADFRISGINPDAVLQSQLQVSSPIDDVLQNSATGFLQALYPPVGSELDAEELRNGSTVTAPMQGYQLIPIGVAESGTGSEDSTWLQGTSDCAKAEVSSNEYFVSDEYRRLYDSTRDFYRNLLPVISGMFSEDDATFENAYEIWDYINVATIHNNTIPSASLLTDRTLFQLRTLADAQQFALAYNASTPIRAVTGMTLAAQITQFLNDSLSTAGSFSGQRLGIQFGAYATFASFFGLAQLPEVNEDFTGVTDYASSMVFEMFTNASKTDYSPEDVFVRFLYHNGTASESDPPTEYPLFGTGENALAWNDFMENMNAFSLGDTGAWCTACGNSTGECAAYVNDNNDDGSSAGSALSSEESTGCSNGVSPAVNGVIGAMVTLAVVLGLEALVLVVFGLRVVSKKRLAQGAGRVVGGGEEMKG